MTKFTLRKIIMTFTLVLTAIFLIACTNNSTDKKKAKQRKDNRWYQVFPG